VVGLGAVAGRVDAVGARPAVPVDPDRAGRARLDASVLREGGVRADADAHDRAVDRDPPRVGHDGLEAVPAGQPVDRLAEVQTDPLLAEVGGDGLPDRLADHRERVAGLLEEVNVDAVGGECLGHLDADVATPDDRDALGRGQRGVPPGPRGVDVTVALGLGVVFAGLLEERPDGRGVVEAVEFERAVQLESIDGVGQCVRPGREQEVVVVLLERPVRPGDGDGPRVGVDRGDLVLAPEVDAPLRGLLGREREQVGQAVDLALHVVGRPAVGVGYPAALLEDDDLAVGVLAQALARGTQPRGVTADDDKPLRHARDHGRRA
jgi:hypothetical protein